MESPNLRELLTELCRASGSGQEYTLETTRKECDDLRVLTTGLPVMVICYDQGKCYLSAASTQAALYKKESLR